MSLERFVWKRFLNMGVIIAVLMGYALFSCIFGGRLWDETACILGLSVICCALFAFVLFHERVRARIAGNVESHYGRVAASCAISAAVMAAGAFLPEYARPAIFPALLLTAMVSGRVALILGMYMDAVLALGMGFSMPELALCISFTLVGCMVADAMEDGKHLFWYEMLILCVQVVFPVLFYFMEYGRIRNVLFVYGAIEGIIIDYVMLLCYKRVVSRRKREVELLLTKITLGDYPLVKELYSFSDSEYSHAKKVSEIAFKCANVVGCNAKVCEAAGLYYRIGVLEDGPSGQTNLAIAQRECFPEDVARILWEYGGECALPSSPESALVHIVDGLVKKLEALKDRDTMQSAWNKDMVIYQTLNEFSTSGIYDKSGMSMNMFLQVREYLAKGEKLL